MSVRGVWQLNTLLLRFCKQGGSSTGLREYIKAGGVQSFAANNPSISVNVVHAAGKHPLAVGKYRDGTSKAIDLRNRGAFEVAVTLEKMRNVATGRVRKFREPVTSFTPTVQGLWDPSNTFEGFSLRESAVTGFPELVSMGSKEAAAEGQQQR